MCEIKITFWDGQTEINKENTLSWKMEENEITKIL